LTQVGQAGLDLVLAAGEGSDRVRDLVGELEGPLVGRRHLRRERQREPESGTEQQGGTPGPGRAAVAVNCVNHALIFLSGSWRRNRAPRWCPCSPLDLQKPGSVPRSGSSCCPPPPRARDAKRVA